jgi:hypothetical protein
MIVKRNTYLIEVSDKFEFPNFSFQSGTPFAIDTKWADIKHQFKKHIGVVSSLPVRITEKYFKEYPLNMGDTVFFSHLVCEDKNKYTANQYYAEHFFIFAKIIDNVLIPLDEF